MPVKSLITSGDAGLIAKVGNELDGENRLYVDAVINSENQRSIPVTLAPSASAAGITDGYVSTSTVASYAIMATTYTEQTVNAQRSLVSTAAADAAAGTGARSVRITYLDQAFAGPYTETVVLNGTTPVNTVASNICYIEKMEVLTAGSGGVNAGTINLKAATGGGGVTVGSIVIGDNKTFWAHHYVPAGKTCYITSYWVGHNGTVVGSGGLFTVKSLNELVDNAAWIQLPGMIRLYGQSSTITRNYGTAQPITGPSLIRLYVFTEASSSLIFRAAIDYYDL